MAAMKPGPTQHASYPRAMSQHSLVRSESAPLSLLEDVPEFSSMSLRDYSSDSTFRGNASRSQICPSRTGGKPSPSRSMSSAELNSSKHLAETFASHIRIERTNISSSSSPSLRRSNQSNTPRKPLARSREKNVFDMIQDDFPRTPAPALSSFLPNTVHEARTLQEGPVASISRRARLASTASLDLDLDCLRMSPNREDESAETAFACSLSSKMSNKAHRRSASINWTGEVGNQWSKQKMQKSESLSKLKYVSSLQNESRHEEKVPFFCHDAEEATAASKSTNLSASPRGPSSSQSSSETRITTAQEFDTISHGTSQLHHHMQRPLSSVGPSDEKCGRDTSPTRRFPSDFPGIYSSTGITNNSMTAFEGYENLIGREKMPVDTPVLTRFSEDVGNSYFYTPLFGTERVSSLHATGAIRPYGPRYYAENLVHSPFSTSFGFDNGANQIYMDAPGENAPVAAEDVKNMGPQVTAFISAQQQLYAAHMMHAAAIARSASVPHLSDPTLCSRISIETGHTESFSETEQSDSPRGSRPENSVAMPGPFPSLTSEEERCRSGSYQLRSSRRGGLLEMPHRGREGRGRRILRQGPTGMVGVSRTDQTPCRNVASDQHHVRSALLEEFRSTSLSICRTPTSFKTAFSPSFRVSASVRGREWQLSEITDFIVEFATDQHGSRFIQQKLEEASKEEIESVLDQAVGDALRLVMDVFGNYVVQKLLGLGGKIAVHRISQELEGRMLQLSLHMYGCRVVQKALEVLGPNSRARLVRELDGHVIQCIRDQNGNHVIQKCVELVQADAIQFIVDSILGQAVVFAGHSYGCRVVQRILEHGAPHQKNPIMAEIMESIADLIKDQYGNYVIQHVVEHGSARERAVVMNLVREEVTHLSQHKFASNVVERCLQFGSPGERRILIDILSGDGGAPGISPLNYLVRDQFGNYVVQRVLDVALSPQRDRVVMILRAQVSTIKRYSYGKHIIARLEHSQDGMSAFLDGHGPQTYNGNGLRSHRLESPTSSAKYLRQSHATTPSKGALCGLPPKHHIRTHKLYPEI